MSFKDMFGMTFAEADAIAATHGPLYVGIATQSVCGACHSKRLGPWRPLMVHSEWRRECDCGKVSQVVRERSAKYRKRCRSEAGERRSHYRHLLRALQAGNKLGAERRGWPPSEGLYMGPLLSFAAVRKASKP